MAKRLTRAARSEANREDVLATARRIFLARGWAGASLEAIAEEAGFSKGVVYSQFGGKADLFLALLDRRITERAAQNQALAAAHRGADAIRTLMKAAREDSEAEAAWALLLLEFRVHALRDPDVHRRYADAHRRAIAGLAELLDRLLAEAGLEAVAPPAELAALIFAVGTGLHLEQATDGRAITGTNLESAVFRLLGLPEQQSGRPRVGGQENPRKAAPAGTGKEVRHVP